MEKGGTLLTDPQRPMAAPQTTNPYGAAKHTGKICRRFQGDIKGGRAVRPHVDRHKDWKRRKIARMKRQAQTTDKIG